MFISPFFIVPLRHHGITGNPVFEYVKHEKPVLRDYPDIHFNLSHCRRGIMCVIDDMPKLFDGDLLQRVYFQTVVDRNNGFVYTICQDSLKSTHYQPNTIPY